jgi:UDP-N-acetylmuramoyl-tripeptide--D-alanyl-D-alanine ligase
VVKTIRGELKATHDIFICEMGAYCLGEIKEICDIAHPNMGIITSIGPQHLETFKTIENVITTKGELFQNVTKGGKIFVNLDDENILKIEENKDASPITFSKNENLLSECDYKVKNVLISGDGTGFDVISTVTGKVYPIKTKLLGAHNIDNMLGSIAIAIELGLTAEDINRALIDIEPVEHRLSYNKTSGGYTILDDAFNSNPVGSKSALDVLKHFPGNKKIVITPGMIELGEKQEELNTKFGEYMSDSCDLVILVGKKQTAPIKVGLDNKNYPEEKIYIAKDLKDALEKMYSVVEKDDVVLLENDLPDIFNE